MKNELTEFKVPREGSLHENGNMEVQKNGKSLTCEKVSYQLIGDNRERACAGGLWMSVGESDQAVES